MTTRARSLRELATTLGMPYQRVSRAKVKGVITADRRGCFDVAACRAAIEANAGRGKHGTFHASGNGSGEARDPELVEWVRRERRAKALMAEVELAVETKKVTVTSVVKRAWIANEMLWRENLKTIARQLGARWGGKIGQEIEEAALKLFDEMFTRMAGDPLLLGADGVKKP